MKVRISHILVAAFLSAPAACGGKSAPRPSQGSLPTMPALALPADPNRAAKVALGHALFFDPRMSVDGTRACYSCHQNEDGNGGRDPIAVGPGEKKLTRHSPVIWNVGYFDGSLYWDGRAKDLEANAKGAWGGGNMGVGNDNLDKKAAELLAIPGYKAMLEAAFPGEAPTAEHFMRALSEYERTLVCDDTAYDRFAKGDKGALTEPQQRGLDVFLGAGCATCHAPPFFSSAMGVPGGVYHHVGIGTGKPESEVDPGRMTVTKKPEDWAAFKPPSLRNVARSAPYFHDGSVARLEEAVDLMLAGGIDNKNKSKALVKVELSAEARADLLAFLGALDCPGKLEAPALP
ncbi:MAG: c-type cytochrome [Deltaproteobacteria bacterium]|nr:c-type cytochrome [Deltaproteobacteria bacterium]